LSTSKKPVPENGWMRSLIFLVVFIGIYLPGHWLYRQTALNVTIGPIYAGAAIFTLATLITLPVFMAFIDKKPLLSIGLLWKLPGNIQVYGAQLRYIAVLMAIAMLGLGWIILYLTDQLEYLGATISLQNIANGFILMCMIAIAEEAVFRGYMLNNLLASFRPWLALVISAMLFAFLHSGNPEAGTIALFNVFLAGIFLGISYIFTRNLWFAIFFHFSWNFLQGPVLGFPVSGLELPAALQVTISGNELITGGKFGYEASIIQTILFIIAIPVLYLYHRNQLPTSPTETNNPQKEQTQN
jgi:membrane protease YdiL (CAAX protease family)